MHRVYRLMTHIVLACLSCRAIEVNITNSSEISDIADSIELVTLLQFGDENATAAVNLTATYDNVTEASVTPIATSLTSATASTSRTSRMWTRNRFRTTKSTRRPKSRTSSVSSVQSSQQTAAPRRTCGRRYARNGRIVGGRDTYEGEFPWAVSVRLLTTHFCGGTIITKNWILTAAHCVKRYQARYFRVRTGERDVNVAGFRPDAEVEVAEVAVHPRFGQPRRYSNDLALLRLKRPLALDVHAQPICLPDAARDPAGRTATAVGWGWMNEIDHVFTNKAGVLQKVQVPVLNNSICATWYAEVYEGYVQIYDYQICAGYKEGGKDACQGDSGGPLMMKDGDRFSIIGVVSAGVGCARKHLPGIYSRVSAFVPWIQNVTGLTGL